LESMTAVNLFACAQRRFLNRMDTGRVLALLRMASQKGLEEAQWLIMLIEAKWLLYPGEELPNFMRRPDSFTLLFDGETSVRAQFYRGMFMQPSERRLTIEDAARRGHAMSQAMLGSMLELQGKFSDATIWCKLSAEQGDALGLYQLGYLKRKEPGCLALYLESAKLGETLAMSNLAKILRRDDSVTSVCWACRSIVFLGHNLSSCVAAIKKRVARCLETLSDNYLLILYVIGREFESYEEFMPRFGLEDHAILQKAVTFYTTMANNARLLAMTTATGLRRTIGRDMATFIAKMVFESRETTEYLKQSMYLLGK
jgi:hypothetical protein